jgi:predicted transcriptional regulator
MPTTKQGPSGQTNGATIALMRKITISLDDDLNQRVREAAGKRGVSAWLAEAAEARLRGEALHEVASEIADETGGPFTEQEKEEARRWLFSSSTPAP